MSLGYNFIQVSFYNNFYSGFISPQYVRDQRVYETGPKVYVSVRGSGVFVTRGNVYCHGDRFPSEIPPGS